RTRREMVYAPSETCTQSQTHTFRIAGLGAQARKMNSGGKWPRLSCCPFVMNVCGPSVIPITPCHVQAPGPAFLDATAGWRCGSRRADPWARRLEDLPATSSADHVGKD